MYVPGIKNERVSVKSKFVAADNCAVKERLLSCREGQTFGADWTVSKNESKHKNIATINWIDVSPPSTTAFNFHII